MLYQLTGKAAGVSMATNGNQAMVMGKASPGLNSSQWTGVDDSFKGNSDWNNPQLSGGMGTAALFSLIIIGTSAAMKKLSKHSNSSWDSKKNNSGNYVPGRGSDVSFNLSLPIDSYLIGSLHEEALTQSHRGHEIFVKNNEPISPLKDKLLVCARRTIWFSTSKLLQSMSTFPCRTAC